ncbi:type II restriction enzyme [Rothia sp. CCM 9416]|uniref:type II restriction enzyme n=1 Tax=Rothia sp. CCM 9416 TaxID=3402655 RepID=UPI003AED0B28
MARVKSKAQIALEVLEDDLKGHFGAPCGYKPSYYHLAWMKLFKELSLLDVVRSQGFVKITPTQIKDHTGMEPRLIAKHDFGQQRPWLFEQYGLNILPLSTQEYVVGKFDTFTKFPTDIDSHPVKRMAFPSHIESIDYQSLTSEAIQLNAAYIGGVFADFLGEESLEHTLSGRMTTGAFDLDISGLPTLAIAGSQMEIDGGYEGKGCLAIVEAKNKLSPDFNSRQLYYPFRRFEQVMSTKPVRNVYQVFSDGVFNLFEYVFEDSRDFTSIRLANRRRYTLDAGVITMAELTNLAHNPPQVPSGYGQATFPQADTFSRVVNACEFIARQGSSTRQEMIEENGFVPRQAKYYGDAGEYLGVFEVSDGVISLTPFGKRLMALDSLKERKLAFAGLILADEVFRQTFLDSLKLGVLPSKERVASIMTAVGVRDSKGEILGATTISRRAATVLSWVRWITNLVTE